MKKNRINKSSKKLAKNVNEVINDLSTQQLVMLIFLLGVSVLGSVQKKKVKKNDKEKSDA